MIFRPYFNTGLLGGLLTLLIIEGTGHASERASVTSGPTGRKTSLTLQITDEPEVWLEAWDVIGDAEARVATISERHVGYPDLRHGIISYQYNQPNSTTPKRYYLQQDITTSWQAKFFYQTPQSSNGSMSLTLRNDERGEVVTASALNDTTTYQYMDVQGYTPYGPYGPTYTNTDTFNGTARQAIAATPVFDGTLTTNAGQPGSVDIVTQYFGRQIPVFNSSSGTGANFWGANTFSSSRPGGVFSAAPVPWTETLAEWNATGIAPGAVESATYSYRLKLSDEDTLDKVQARIDRDRAAVPIESIPWGKERIAKLGGTIIRDHSTWGDELWLYNEKDYFLTDGSFDEQRAQIRFNVPPELRISGVGYRGRVIESFYPNSDPYDAKVVKIHEVEMKEGQWESPIITPTVQEEDGFTVLQFFSMASELVEPHSVITIPSTPNDATPNEYLTSKPMIVSKDLAGSGYGTRQVLTGSATLQQINLIDSWGSFSDWPDAKVTWSILPSATAGIRLWHWRDDGTSLGVWEQLKSATELQDFFGSDTDFIFAELLSSGHASVRITITLSGQSVHNDLSVKSFQPELAVDADRDGVIKLASENASDATSSSNAYRFWSNDDIDRVHTVDGSDSEEDDLFTSPDGKLDWEENSIQSKRDLEDFARLQLYIVGLHEAIKGGQLHIGLKWTDVSGGSPSIKIYEHNSTDGSATYLTDPAAASAQLLSLTGPGQPRYAIRDARYQNDDPETSTHTLIEGTGTFILPSSIFVFLNETTPKKFLLFEGCNIGKGQLKIVILKKEGENYTEIGDGPGVWLDLKKIDQFYERWTAGDGNGGAPENTATRQKLLGRSGNVVSYGNGFEYPANATEEKKYILYVHGWNMQPEEKNRFAETAFKRLYWQGYKGRFGVFCWPTTYDFGSLVQDNRVVKTWLNSGYSAATDPTNYDRGEWAAWRSAFPLMQLLTSLRSNYTSVNVMAHSMGNVVAGEALRRLSNVGTSNVVDCYVASQAAVPAHTYDGSIPSDLLADVPLLTLIQYSDGGHPETPNIYPNWLAGNGVAAGRRVNFYNVNDYALWRDVWEANQFLKPDGPDDPDQPWTYKYLGDVNTVQDLFKRRTPVWTESLRLGTQTIPNDQFEIMAFAAESRSRAVGAEPERLGMTRSLDLTTIWPDDTGQRGSDGQKWGAHKWHSAQFRSTNMRQKGYWEALLDERGFNLRSSP